MNTRTAFESLTGRPAEEVSLRDSRLVEKFAATAQAKAAEIERKKAAPQVSAAHLRAANSALYQASNDGHQYANVPVVDNFTAYHVAKRASENLKGDSGVRTAALLLKARWEKDPMGSLTAGDLHGLKKHLAQTVGHKSAAHELVVSELPKCGFAQLPLRQLNQLVAQVTDQESFESVCRQAGLVGSRPDQVQARAYIIAQCTAQAQMEAPVAPGMEQEGAGPPPAKEETPMSLGASRRAGGDPLSADVPAQQPAAMTGPKAGDGAAALAADSMGGGKDASVKRWANHLLNGGTLQKKGFRVAIDDLARVMLVSPNGSFRTAGLPHLERVVADFWHLTADADVMEPKVNQQQDNWVDINQGEGGDILGEDSHADEKATDAIVPSEKIKTQHDPSEQAGTSNAVHAHFRCGNPVCASVYRGAFVGTPTWVAQPAIWQRAVRNQIRQAGWAGYPSVLAAYQGHVKRWGGAMQRTTASSQPSVASPPCPSCNARMGRLFVATDAGTVLGPMRNQDEPSWGHPKNRGPHNSKPTDQPGTSSPDTGAATEPMHNQDESPWMNPGKIETSRKGQQAAVQAQYYGGVPMGRSSVTPLPPNDEGIQLLKDQDEYDADDVGMCEHEIAKKYHLKPEDIEEMHMLRDKGLMYTASRTAQNNQGDGYYGGLPMGKGPDKSFPLNDEGKELLKAFDNEYGEDHYAVCDHPIALKYKLTPDDILEMDGMRTKGLMYTANIKNFGDNKAEPFDERDAEEARKRKSRSKGWARANLKDVASTDPADRYRQAFANRPSQALLAGIADESDWLARRAVAQVEAMTGKTVPQTRQASRQIRADLAQDGSGRHSDVPGHLEYVFKFNAALGEPSRHELQAYLDDCTKGREWEVARMASLDTGVIGAILVQAGTPTPAFPGDDWDTKRNHIRAAMHPKAQAGQDPAGMGSDYNGTMMGHEGQGTPQGAPPVSDPGMVQQGQQNMTTAPIKPIDNAPPAPKESQMEVGGVPSAAPDNGGGKSNVQAHRAQMAPWVRCAKLLREQGHNVSARQVQAYHRQTNYTFASPEQFSSVYASQHGLSFDVKRAARTAAKISEGWGQEGAFERAVEAESAEDAWKLHKGLNGHEPQWPVQAQPTPTPPPAGGPPPPPVGQPKPPAGGPPASAESAPPPQDPKPDSTGETRLPEPSPQPMEGQKEEEDPGMMPQEVRQAASFFS